MENNNSFLAEINTVTIPISHYDSMLKDSNVISAIFIAYEEAIELQSSGEVSLIGYKFEEMVTWLFKTMYPLRYESLIKNLQRKKETQDGEEGENRA